MPFNTALNFSPLVAASANAVFVFDTDRVVILKIDEFLLRYAKRAAVTPENVTEREETLRFIERNERFVRRGGTDLRRRAAEVTEYDTAAAERPRASAEADRDIVRAPTDAEIDAVCRRVVILHRQTRQTVAVVRSSD